MAGYPEPLERFFQQVEEETERRAEEERRRAEELDKFVSEASTVKKVKERRRGSISISRLGQYALEESLSKTAQPSPKGFSSIASSSPFYQTQIANASKSSFASGASAFSDDNAHTEDLSQVIQIQQIPSKQSSISRIIPRRLSRARSASVVPVPTDVSFIGIDVSVQETTVHSSTTSVDENGGESQAPSRRASVHAAAARSLRGQTSRSSMRPSTPTGWVAKARGFTQKFRRRSKQEFVAPEPQTAQF